VREGGQQREEPRGLGTLCIPAGMITCSAQMRSLVPLRSITFSAVAAHGHMFLRCNAVRVIDATGIGDRKPLESVIGCKRNR
jgi:hypothetical protein